uniref:Uncharacterized protein n=1 Tax=Marseillevirus LCMAC102 TaxID=2506603 RepID=A0A481YSH5_9VIRU|nr:MAG: uncharacterized protein LCMAC102_00170 [Marseillevirus LCMAC102]
MIRNITVTRQPRNNPIPDKPSNFPPLDNLHLELLENKKKLKKGLPLVPLQKRRPPQPRHTETSEKKQSDEKSLPNDEDTDIMEELGDDEENDKVKEESEEEKDGEDEVAEEDEKQDEDDIYAGLSPEEREIKEREEYIWRFRILKKQYKNPSVPIPDFNEHSDLPMMKNSYERTIKELYLDESVESYRTYLVGGFIVLEFVCTQWIGIDLSGFTIQQTAMMYKYDRLLIELGEKSYSRWGMDLPVEVRLIGLLIMQAGIFYLGKIISDKFGNSIAELFKGVTGQPPPPEHTSNTELPKKRKMRGPRIKPEDIRNMSHAQAAEDSDRSL